MRKLLKIKENNFTTPPIKRNKSLNKITKYFFLFIVTCLSLPNKGIAQYDTIQYLPPIYIANVIKNSDNNIKDHYLVLSTLESNSFSITLRDGSGSLFTSYSLEKGTQVSQGVVNLSRTNPIKIKFSGKGVNVQNIVSRDSLNTPIITEGLYFEASKPFFANIRHQSGSQAGSLTTKGNSGLGKDFFVGFQNMQNSSSSVNNNESHFFSVMATEDNTSITFTNFKPGTTFYGRGINTSTSPVTATDTTIILNRGESFVQAQEKHLMPDYSTTNDYNGIRILADKNIAVNSGSLLAVQDANGRDIGMDQIVPTRLAGNKYGILKGNGDASREKVIVISTEAGTTNITTSTGTAIINGIGQHVILNGSHWNNVNSPSIGTSHANMVFTSDKPVLVYHTTFGANAGNASSLNIIPPVADCIGSDSIYVADALQFGTSSKINVISKVGSTIYIEDEAGNSLLTIPSTTASNFGGTSLNTHLSTSFTIPSSVTDIFVHGDDKFSLGFFGASGVAGGAGYMSSFSLTNVEWENNSSVLLTNGGDLKIDLCEVSSATLGVTNPEVYSSFQWFKDESQVTGATNSTLNVNSKGDYYVKATYCSFDIAASKVSVDHFGTPGNNGINTLESSFNADVFDGAGSTFNVSTWFDNGKNNNNATGANGPKVFNGLSTVGNGNLNNYGREKYFTETNYSSALEFDKSSSNYLKTADALDSINGTTNFSFFIVLKNNNTQNNRPVISFSNEANSPRLIKKSWGYQFIQGASNNSDFKANIATDISQFHIISGVYDGSSITLYSDGKKGTSISTTAGLNIFSEVIIGAGAEGSSHFFDGLIQSSSVFNISLSNFERQKIESSYALKYGITLDNSDDETTINDGDYVSTYGTVVWDYSQNSAYHNGVFGVGLDECGKLNQKQATSIEGEIMTIGLGTLTNYNSTNTETHAADNSFFIVGSNNEEEDSFKVTDYGTTLNGENIEARIKRIWKGQQTGTVNQLTIKFDLSKMGNGSGGKGTNDLTKVRLLVDTDEIFANGATSIPPNSYDQTTGIITFNHNFESSTGFFFTLATIDAAGASLPIELTYFDAQLNGKVVNLHWQTASEINNHYFIVERSSDANQWTEITRQEGAGNSTISIDYFDLDNTPLYGTSYYRLKQVDIDGNYSYSNIVSILNNNNKTEGINIFPNPSDGRNINLVFKGNKGDELYLNIKDLQGKECYSTSKMINSNNNIINLNIVNQLSKGTYIITATSASNTFSKKLVVK